MATIGFVPARGGSRRIPRKNLTAVQGVPLVVRTVRLLFGAGVDRVIVSTEDHEIANCAMLAGAEIDVRHPDLASHQARVDQVVNEWAHRAGLDPADVVVIAQPTSPLLTPATVMNAVDRCGETGETILSVVPERHLLWSDSSTPLFRERRNSDDGSEPFYFRETGGLLVACAGCLAQPSSAWPPGTVTLMEVEEAEGIDLDEYSDLTRARAGARPARIQLRYTEGIEVGSGHRRRCEALAVELQGHHEVEVVRRDEATLDPLPDLVVLDTLDTTADEAWALRAAGVRWLLTLEDRGDGAALANAVVNEMYGPASRPPQEALVPSLGPDVKHTWLAPPLFRCGPRWAVLRAEFQGHRRKLARKEEPYVVVVSFGGTDPAGLTESAVRLLRRSTDPASVQIRVVVPPSRPDWRMDVSGLPGVEIVSRPFMAAEFLTADLAVTSSGRTVHEAAACGCPVVAIAANERELEHDVCPGVEYLGFSSLEEPPLAEWVASLLRDPEERQKRADEAQAAVDGLGAQRIGWLIDGLIGDML